MGRISIRFRGLFLERGYDGFCKEEWIAGHKRNIYLLLRHLGMYEAQEPKVYEHTIYLESKKAGLWYPVVKQNDRVRKGQLLGRLEDMFGTVLEEFYAKENGVVFYYTGDFL
jgi:predicted deacylase